MKSVSKLVSIGLLCICTLVTSPLITAAVIRSSPLIETESAVSETETADTLSETAAATETETETSTEPEPETETLDFTEGDSSYFADALFIGDAHIGQLRQFGTLHEAEYLCGAGLTTQMLLDGDAMEGTTFPDKLASKPYGKIYLMVGFHETEDGADAFRTNLEAVVEEIRQAQPEAYLFLMANQYVTEEAGINDPPHSGAFLLPINDAMETLADGQTVFYLDCNTLFSDKRGCLAKAATSDGAHLREELFPELCTWLCGHIIEVPEPPTEESTEDPDAPFTFGDAVEALRQGNPITRQCWEEQVIVLHDGILQMQTTDGLEPWTPGQDDLLADDWMLVS